MKKISKLLAMFFFGCSLVFGVCACSTSVDYDGDDAEQVSPDNDGRSVGDHQRYGGYPVG